MSHDHDHAPIYYGKAFAIGITLNLVFVLIEAFYGWQAASLALLADAAHNLSDVGGLLLAWAGFAAGRLKPNSRHTYGWRRGSILASFANAIILLVAMGSLAWEAIQRFQTPALIDATPVMVVAGIGVIINTATAWLFLSGSKGDLNIRGAFLHMTADALVSVGVVVAGALYLWQGWTWIDPVVSLLIALVVVLGTWSLFHRSLHMLFDGVPDGIDISAVHQSLLDIAGVRAVHDLHVWAMSTAENALTAHLVIEADTVDRDALLRQAMDCLYKQFELRHIALQCESQDFASHCPLNEVCSPVIG